MKLTKNSKIHFMGIGGSGMSAIARICLEKGFKISGSDLKESVNTIRLRNMGAKIFLEHDPAHIRGVHYVVVSGAIDSNNQELVSAIQAQIPIIKRAEFLGYLMDSYAKKIAVTGTHGKTTTTSMTTMLLDVAKLKPTYLIGADMNDFGGNAALGKGDYFVAESDESDGSFLLINPNIGVITNIEPEHMNYFKTIENLHSHFSQFIEKVIKANGYLIINKDDETLTKLCKDLDQTKISYFSIKADSEIKAADIEPSEHGIKYTLIINNKPKGTVYLKVHGMHNVYNSLAAIGVGLKEEIPLDIIIESFSRFSGTRRRLQLVGEIHDIRVYDDYGHHPTEIRATLEAIRQSFKRRIFCIFQPHRYSRTQDLLDEFASSFQDADAVIITEIYSANESAIPGLSSKLIIKKMKDQHPTAKFIAQKSKIPEYLLTKLAPGDLVITMGAGDIHLIGKEIINRLKNKFSKFEEKKTTVNKS